MSWYLLVTWLGSEAVLMSCGIKSSVKVNELCDRALSVLMICVMKSKININWAVWPRAESTLIELCDWDESTLIELCDRAELTLIELCDWVLNEPKKIKCFYVFHFLFFSQRCLSWQSKGLLSTKNMRLLTTFGGIILLDWFGQANLLSPASHLSYLGLLLAGTSPGEK